MVEMKNTKQTRKSFSPQKTTDGRECVNIEKHTIWCLGVQLICKLFSSFEGDGGYDDVDENGDGENGDDGGIM